jgi:hypothetical protein
MWLIVISRRPSNKWPNGLTANLAAHLDVASDGDPEHVLVCDDAAPVGVSTPIGVSAPIGTSSVGRERVGGAGGVFVVVCLFAAVNCKAKVGVSTLLA